MAGGTTVTRRVSEEVLWRNGYPSFSRDEIERRHAAIRAELAKQKLDTLLFYGSGRFHSDILYLTNWPGSREAFVLLPVDGDPVLLVQLFNHTPMAERLSLISDTRWAGPESVATVAETLKEKKLDRGRIGLAGALTFSAYEKLKALLPDAAFVDAGRILRDLRLIRTEEEMGFFRVAAELTDRSIDRLEQQLRPGMRECDLPALVEGPYLEEGGYAGIHFMASTPMHDPQSHVFVPHQYQSNRVLREGDAIISEISGAFWGYSGQIHRTFFLGQPTPEWVRLHEVAEEAYNSIEGVLHDGATAEDVMEAADVIDRAGYSIWDDLFHGANQYPPILRTKQTDHGYPKGFMFRENMVVTIQPQVITRDLRMGLQYGETVLITRSGTERLHRYPRKMVVIDPR